MANKLIVPINVQLETCTSIAVFWVFDNALLVEEVYTTALVLLCKAGVTRKTVVPGRIFGVSVLYSKDNTNQLCE